MSTDLISQLQQSSQLVTKGLNEDTLAVAGGAGSSSKRISIKGGVFRKYVNGKEMGAIDERFMDVIFVRMAHNPHRIFYASSYKEGEKVTPSCWSSDSRVPDKEVKEPQAPACINVQIVLKVQTQAVFYTGEQQLFYQTIQKKLCN
jgi:hypothetical protein